MRGAREDLMEKSALNIAGDGVQERSVDSGKGGEG